MVLSTNSKKIGNIITLLQHKAAHHMDAIEVKKRSKNFMNACGVWLYWGAWYEWESYQIEIAVPLSPDQGLKKRHAIFYHQSQKNGIMFQGDDNREFGVRVEDSNREIAKKRLTMNQISSHRSKFSTHLK